MGYAAGQDSGDGSFDLIGIGVSVWDTILRIPKFPGPGEVVRASERHQSLGGGVTVAVATAASLGSSAAMIDVLGDDVASRSISETLSLAGVDCRAVQQCAATTCSLATIWTLESDAERSIVYSPGSACDRLEWSSDIEAMIGGARVIHCNGRHPEICDLAIKVAKDAGTKISFDGGAYRYRQEILPMLRAADIAIVARHFAGEFYRDCHQDADPDCITSMDSSDLARFVQAELACEIAGVTDGARGSHLIDSAGLSIHQPAVAVGQAIDTTGCGDAYHGAFLHAYARGMGLEESALLAADVAGKTAGQMGGFRLS